MTAVSDPRTVAKVVDYVRFELARRADPEKAGAMQAYMKTDMPFYGVQKPARLEILRGVVARIDPSDQAEYTYLVEELWRLPHREEKYLALAVAERFAVGIVPESLVLYRRLIVEGAWWDLVDEVATKLIGRLIRTHPAKTWPVVDDWIDDDDMWLRRAALICQVGAKERTDRRRLFTYCVASAHEKEFFIRKAIGWALREYSKTAPDQVAGFVTEHEDVLSPLSYREATRHIGHLVGRALQ